MLTRGSDMGHLLPRVERFGIDSCWRLLGRRRGLPLRHHLQPSGIDVIAQKVRRVLGVAVNPVVLREQHTVLGPDLKHRPLAVALTPLTVHQNNLNHPHAMGGMCI